MVGYDPDKLYSAAMAAIKKHGLYFIADVIAHLPCNNATFYKYFNSDSERLNDIKDALEKNRMQVKQDLRKKWSVSDNATLQISLYKLIADNDERKKLATSYNQHTGEGGGSIEHSLKIEDHRVIFEKYKDA